MEYNVRSRSATINVDIYVVRYGRCENIAGKSTSGRARRREAGHRRV
jgi:hypothetical protein